jgi:hypothetical protein
MTATTFPDLVAVVDSANPATHDTRSTKPGTPETAPARPDTLSVRPNTAGEAVQGKPARPDTLSVRPNTAGEAVQGKPARPDTLRARPNREAEDSGALYLPTMLAVYTARHQNMPKSDGWLYRHVFGLDGDAGCEACREETEFLVAHQKNFIR